MEISSSLIVQVLWKSEPEVMAEEVSSVKWSLDADWLLPTYISSGSCTKSSDAFDCVQA